MEYFFPSPLYAGSVYGSNKASFALKSEERIIPVVIGSRRPGDADFLVADPTKAVRQFAFGDAGRVPGTELERSIELRFLSMLYRPLGYDLGGYPAKPAVPANHPVLEFYPDI